MHTVSLDLPEISFFGRGFSEYLLFFGLRPTELAGRRALDCGAGPSAFTAEAAMRGIDVTAVDPLYNRSEAALRRIAYDSSSRMFARMRATPDLFLGHTFDSIDAAATERRAAMERFLSDYYVGVALGRYRCGALPALPFPDRAFDLGLCAHLLFVYDHLLDLDFHVAAARELCRVARDEVRIHPIVNRTGKTSPLFAPVREALAGEGIRSELVDVDHAFFCGASRTLAAAVRDFGLRRVGRCRRLRSMTNPSPTPAQPVLGTRRVCQIAVVVRDIEKSARAYAAFFALPVPSFITTDGSHGGHHIFRGRPTNACCMLAFFELENTTIELIQPLGGDSSWQAILDEKGECIHHIAFQVKDSPGKTRALAAAGMPLLHQGGDPATGQFSYFDARNKLGILIETLEGYR